MTSIYCHSEHSAYSGKSLSRIKKISTFLSAYLHVLAAYPSKYLDLIKSLEEDDVSSLEHKDWGDKVFSNIVKSVNIPALMNLIGPTSLIISTICLSMLVMYGFLEFFIKIKWHRTVLKQQMGRFYFPILFLFTGNVLKILILTIRELCRCRDRFLPLSEISGGFEALHGGSAAASTMIPILFMETYPSLKCYSIEHLLILGICSLMAVSLALASWFFTLSIDLLYFRYIPRLRLPSTLLIASIFFGSLILPPLLLPSTLFSTASSPKVHLHYYLLLPALCSFPSLYLGQSLAGYLLLVFSLYLSAESAFEELLPHSLLSQRWVVYTLLAVVAIKGWVVLEERMQKHQELTAKAIKWARNTQKLTEDAPDTECTQGGDGHLGGQYEKDLMGWAQEVRTHEMDCKDRKCEVCIKEGKLDEKIMKLVEYQLKKSLRSKDSNRKKKLLYLEFLLDVKIDLLAFSKILYLKPSNKDDSNLSEIEKLTLKYKLRCLIADYQDMGFFRRISKVFPDLANENFDKLKFIRILAVHKNIQENGYLFKDYLLAQQTLYIEILDKARLREIFIHSQKLATLRSIIGNRLMEAFNLCRSSYAPLLKDLCYYYKHINFDRLEFYKVASELKKNWRSKNLGYVTERNPLQESVVVEMSMIGENQHRIMSASGQTNMILGYQKSELIGRDLSLILPNYIASFHKKVSSVSTMKETILEMTMPRKILYKRKDEFIYNASVRVRLFNCKEEGLRYLGSINVPSTTNSVSSNSKITLIVSEDGIVTDLTSSANQYFTIGKEIWKLTKLLETKFNRITAASKIIQIEKFDLEDYYSDHEMHLCILSYVKWKQGRLINIVSKSGRIDQLFVKITQHYFGDSKMVWVFDMLPADDFSLDLVPSLEQDCYLKTHNKYNFQNLAKFSKLLDIYIKDNIDGELADAISQGSNNEISAPLNSEFIKREIGEPSKISHSKFLGDSIELQRIVGTVNKIQTIPTKSTIRLINQKKSQVDSSLNIGYLSDNNKVLEEEKIDYSESDNLASKTRSRSNNLGDFGRIKEKIVGRELSFNGKIILLVIIILGITISLSSYISDEAYIRNSQIQLDAHTLIPLMTRIRSSFQGSMFYLEQLRATREGYILPSYYEDHVEGATTYVSAKENFELITDNILIHALNVKLQIAEINIEEFTHDGQVKIEFAAVDEFGKVSWEATEMDYFAAMSTIYGVISSKILPRDYSDNQSIPLLGLEKNRNLDVEEEFARRNLQGDIAKYFEDKSTMIMNYIRDRSKKSLVVIEFGFILLVIILLILFLFFVTFILIEIKNTKLLYANALCLKVIF